MYRIKKGKQLTWWLLIVIYMVIAFYVVLDIGGNFGFAAFFIVPPKSYSVIPLLILAFLIPITLATVPLTVMTKKMHRRQLLLCIVMTYGFICCIESVIFKAVDFRDYLEITFPAVLFLLIQFVILLFLQRLWERLGQNGRRSVLILSLVFLFSLWGYLWSEYDFDIKELEVFHIVKFLKIITGL